MTIVVAIVAEAAAAVFLAAFLVANGTDLRRIPTSKIRPRSSLLTDGTSGAGARAVDRTRDCPDMELANAAVSEPEPSASRAVAGAV
jgi:hypothetical protein